MRCRASAFLKYMIVGVFNTLVHLAVFSAMQVFTGCDQAISNLAAFFVALSFSFVANATYTFRAPISLIRYLTFVAVMGSFSALVGSIADLRGWPPSVTFVVFSAVSLSLGFLFAKRVFMERRRWIFR